MFSNPLGNRWQRLTEAEVRHWQAERLRWYLRDYVLPFSAHYRKLFSERGLSAESFRTLQDLERVPFTTKADLLNTREAPQRFKDFILVPDEAVLAKRPGTILRALRHGRKQV